MSGRKLLIWFSEYELWNQVFDKAYRILTLERKFSISFSEYEFWERKLSRGLAKVDSGTQVYHMVSRI